MDRRRYLAALLAVGAGCSSTTADPTETPPDDAGTTPSESTDTPTSTPTAGETLRNAAALGEPKQNASGLEVIVTDLQAA